MSVGTFGPSCPDSKYSCLSSPVPPILREPYPILIYRERASIPINVTEKIIILYQASNHPWRLITYLGV